MTPELGSYNGQALLKALKGCDKYAAVVDDSIPPPHFVLLAHTRACLRAHPRSASPFIKLCREILTKHADWASAQLLRLACKLSHGPQSIPEVERNACRSTTLLVVQVVVKQLGNTLSGSDTLLAVRALCAADMVGPATQVASGWLTAHGGPIGEKFATDAWGILSKVCTAVHVGTSPGEAILLASRQHAAAAIEFQLLCLSSSLQWEYDHAEESLTRGTVLPVGMPQVESWQWAMIEAVERNESIVVVAPTGSGKTHIALHIIT